MRGGHEDDAFCLPVGFEDEALAHEGAAAIGVDFCFEHLAVVFVCQVFLPFEDVGDDGPGFVGVVEAGDEAAHGVAYHDHGVDVARGALGVILLDGAVEGVALAVGGLGPGHARGVGIEPELVVLANEGVDPEAVGEVGEGAVAREEAVSEDDGDFVGVVGFGEVEAHVGEATRRVEQTEEGASVLFAFGDEGGYGGAEVGSEGLADFAGANVDAFLPEPGDESEGGLALLRAFGVKVDDGGEGVHVSVVHDEVFSHGPGVGFDVPGEGYAHAFGGDAFAE